MRIVNVSSFLGGIYFETKIHPNLAVENYSDTQLHSPGCIISIIPRLVRRQGLCMGREGEGHLFSEAGPKVSCFVTSECVCMYVHVNSGIIL